MASGNTAGPSGIVPEMLKPVSEAGAVDVHDHIEDIPSDRCIPTDRQKSYIVNRYKGKRDALNKEQLQGLEVDRKSNEGDGACGGGTHRAKS